jgi:hypothetical protein
MAFDIFSYRAHPRYASDFVPTSLANTSLNPSGDAAELEHLDGSYQAPWDQIKTSWLLRSYESRPLEAMHVPVNLAYSSSAQPQDLETPTHSTNGIQDPSHILKDLTPRQLVNDNETQLRCFEHDCQGRTFSCAENYRRHIREKEKSAKVYCTLCRMSFTRRSNLRKHVSERRCVSFKAILKTSNLRAFHVPL